MNDVDPMESGQGESPAVDSSIQSGADAPAAPTPTPSPSATPTEQFFEVKIGGQTRKVALNELLSGYSRTQDYTQKTMQLAEDRRRFEQAIQGERDQYKTFLSNADNVKQLYDYLVAQRGIQNPNQPNQPLTLAQYNALRVAEQQRQAQERQQMFDELETKQLEHSYKSEVDKTVSEILTANPELRSIHMIERIMKMAAAQKQPATIEDAIGHMKEFATEQVGRIRSQFAEAQKQAALAKTNLTQKGTEPPGGAAPMPSAKPAFKLGDPRLAADAAEMLRQLMNDSK